MNKGVGLVALHEASTLPANDSSVDLIGWLGGARYGMFDRTIETVTLVPLKHPISRGMHSFTYRDEFYPTLRFTPDSQHITLISRQNSMCSSGMERPWRTSRRASSPWLGPLREGMVDVPLVSQGFTNLDNFQQPDLRNCCSMRSFGAPTLKCRRMAFARAAR
jgi:hypothetical protein